jgi:hypothetical protein
MLIIRKRLDWVGFFILLWDWCLRTFLWNNSQMNNGCLFSRRQEIKNSITSNVILLYILLLTLNHSWTWMFIIVKGNLLILKCLRNWHRLLIDKWEGILLCRILLVLLLNPFINRCLLWLVCNLKKVRWIILDSLWMNLIVRKKTRS